MELNLDRKHLEYMITGYIFHEKYSCMRLIMILRSKSILMSCVNYQTIHFSREPPKLSWMTPVN